MGDLGRGNPFAAARLQSDIKADRASVTMLRGEALLRLTLAARDGAWFITEHEVVDDALPEFADALRGRSIPTAAGGWSLEPRSTARPNTSKN